MKTKILADFQICISAPLRPISSPPCRERQRLPPLKKWKQVTPISCWGWLSILNWIWALTLSLLLKLPPKKLEPWFVLWSFFLLRLLCISINFPYAHAWNTIVGSGLVPQSFPFVNHCECYKKCINIVPRDLPIFVLYIHSLLLGNIKLLWQLFSSINFTTDHFSMIYITRLF